MPHAQHAEDAGAERASQLTRVSQYSHLGRSQPQLDFVDVSMDTDTAVFVDPSALTLLKTDWGHACVAMIQHYFGCVLHAIGAGDNKRALALLGQLHEPNETRLGLSKGLIDDRPAAGDTLSRLADVGERLDAEDHDVTGRETGPDDAVFPACYQGSQVPREGHDGRLRPMIPATIGHMVRRRMAAVELVGKRYSAHALRATAATMSHQKGNDIAHIQVMMRHARLETTIAYLRDVDSIANKGAASWDLGDELRAALDQHVETEGPVGEKPELSEAA